MSGHAIAHNADALLHDGEYRDHEYPNQVGWGHSCTADALHFVEKAGVEKLVLFHHDPYHTDVELEKLLAEAQGQ
jgi:ribonuclease BN (tRNA processing enzyme)